MKNNRSIRRHMVNYRDAIPCRNSFSVHSNLVTVTCNEIRQPLEDIKGLSTNKNNKIRSTKERCNLL